MTLAVAILMKDPTEAKTRLRPALANDAREELALLLFESTLRFFARVGGAHAIGVVTRSPIVRQITLAHGAFVIEESGRGINAAAGCAADWAVGIGASSLLVIHADIATLVDAEMAQVLAAGKEHSVVIAQSADGGTNALLLTPPKVIPFCFGPQSAAAHEALARKNDRSCACLQLTYLRKDIDTPQDLAAEMPSFARNAERDARSSFSPRAECFAVGALPPIVAGDDLAQIIGQALGLAGQSLRAGDIVVVAQKIVSKSEGRLVPAKQFVPSQRALNLAAEIGKDPHKVEAILSESSQVLRARRQPPDGLLITRHRQGWICANAGIDESNLGEAQDGMLLLLPQDPDASARALRAGLEAQYAAPIGVIVSDTFGRPWRNGLVNIALGVAGVPALVDWRGRTDTGGRILKATIPAFADEVAAAAGLLMQKDAGLPVVVMRGLHWQEAAQASARDVLRPIAQELFL